MVLLKLPFSQFLTAGILHFKQLFERHLNESWSIKVFQLRSETSYRDVLWDVKRSNEKNIILDVRTEILPEVLNQAQQVAILTEEHSYLITSLVSRHSSPLISHFEVSLSLKPEGHSNC